MIKTSGKREVFDILEAHKRSQVNKAQNTNKRISKINKFDVMRIQTVQRAKAKELDQTRLSTLAMFKQIGFCQISETFLVKKLEQRYLQESNCQPSYGNKPRLPKDQSDCDWKNKVTVQPKPIILNRITDKKNSMITFNQRRKTTISLSRNRNSKGSRKKVTNENLLEDRLETFYDLIDKDKQGKMAKLVFMEDSHGDEQYIDARKLPKKQFYASVRKWHRKGECSISPPTSDSRIS